MSDQLAQMLQSPTFDQIINAIKDVGFPIVAFVLLVIVVVLPSGLLMRYVILDAIRYFTGRLDTMQAQTVSLYERMIDSMDRQTEQVSMNREQAARNNETLRILLQFMSHTQEEITGHRSLTEKPIKDIESATVKNPAEGGT